ncbi:MAG: precorrin-2 C(20)-methyltransferase [Methyloligellaceae bacterium]
MIGRKGILYGVGVGPGDPELMTLKAVRVIEAAKVVAYPVNAEGHSQARACAAAILPQDVTELPVHIPMHVDRAPAQAAYDAAATQIAAHLDAGRDTAWLCVGDPLFYGSFIYLAARLEGAHEVRVVPGITAVSACAAQACAPLASRAEVLSVIPATLEEAALRRAVAGADTSIIIKVGRHFEKVRRVLEAAGLSARAHLFRDATRPQQHVARLSDLEQADSSYFSTILIRREQVP